MKVACFCGTVYQTDLELAYCPDCGCKAELVKAPGESVIHPYNSLEFDRDLYRFLKSL